METNTANLPSSIYLLRYTCEEIGAYVCGVWDAYTTLPKARKELRAAMGAMRDKGYTCSVDSPTRDLVIMHNISMARTYQLYIEQLPIH